MDQSLNFPTSWSWNFGDGNTSTVQNPTHAYASVGTYHVALTATNASGNNTATKPSYITVTSAQHSGGELHLGRQPDGGAALRGDLHGHLDQYADLWSWTFGDGSTSTAQNPSHTYTTTGIYTVSLKATNASGNNTRTVTNLIGCCNEVMKYTDTISVTNGTIVSGGLTDIQNDDSNYQNVAVRRFPRLSRKYQVTTNYTPSQLYGVRFEYKGHGTQAATPNATLWMRSVNDGASQLVSAEPDADDATPG